MTKRMYCLVWVTMLMLLVTGIGYAAPEVSPIDSFVWVGRDADKVGVGGDGYPNGVLDGHFKLKLIFKNAVEVSAINVFPVDASGKSVSGQAWSTKDKKQWILGVYDEKGAPYSYKHVDALNKFSDKMTLDLYCNDAGTFKEGQSFMVELVTTFGKKYTQIVTLGASAGDPKLNDVVWIGKDADKTSTGAQAQADGAMDGHFRIQANLPERDEIRAVALYKVESDGKTASATGWHSRNRTYPVLAIFSELRQLNMAHSTSLGIFEGKFNLDLYAADINGVFKPGQTFMVEVTLGSGTVLTKNVKVQ